MDKILNLDFNTVVTLVGFVLTAAGLYWKVKMEIMKLKIEIESIKAEQMIRWTRHDEMQDKQDAYMSDIMHGISEMRGDIKQIKESIEWLKTK